MNSKATRVLLSASGFLFTKRRRSVLQCPEVRPHRSLHIAQSIYSGSSSTSLLVLATTPSYKIWCPWTWRTTEPEEWRRFFQVAKTKQSKLLPAGLPGTVQTEPRKEGRNTLQEPLGGCYCDSVSNGSWRTDNRKATQLLGAPTLTR